MPRRNSCRAVQYELLLLGLRRTKSGQAAIGSSHPPSPTGYGRGKPLTPLPLPVEAVEGRGGIHIICCSNRATSSRNKAVRRCLVV